MFSSFTQRNSVKIKGVLNQMGIAHSSSECTYPDIFIKSDRNPECRVTIFIYSIIPCLAYCHIVEVRAAEYYNCPDQPILDSKLGRGADSCPACAPFKSDICIVAAIIDCRDRIGNRDLMVIPLPEYQNRGLSPQIRRDRSQSPQYAQSVWHPEPWQHRPCRRTGLRSALRA